MRTNRRNILTFVIFSYYHVCYITTSTAFTPTIFQIRFPKSFGLSLSSSDHDEEGIQDDTQDFSRESIFPKPFQKDPAKSRIPNKSVIYEEDELQALLSIHQDFIAPQQLPTSEDKNPLKDDLEEVFGLHKTVLQILEEEGGGRIDDEPAVSQLMYSSEWLDDDTKLRIGQIRAIASDIDGTLLTSQQTIHPRTKQAVQRAISMSFSPIESFQWFFPATGKSRAGVLNSVGPEIGQLLSQTPGVFLQGLYCVDGMGNVVYERKLNTLAVEAVEVLAKENNVSIIAYDGDTLLTTEITETVRELATKYGEPMPKKLEKAISEHGPSVHKILLLDQDSDRLSSVVRPKLEALAKEYCATVTQAMPTMLELLPEDCSKATGVRKLCEHMGIEMSTQLLALGDAENDSTMLKDASIGVAMGNASPIACEAADFVMKETNDDGGAGAAIEVFAFGQY